MKRVLAASVFFASLFFLAGFDRRLPPAPKIIPFDNSAGEDAVFAAFGLRKTAADINFIRLLAYYGAAEDEEEFAEYSVYGLSSDSRSGYEGGVYPQIFDRTMHILSLDPGFEYCALYSAGALAFNLKRHSEASKILAYAIANLPKSERLKTYLAAVAVSSKGGDTAVLDTLDKVIMMKDTPALVKQITAFANKKAGRLKRAYEIYKDIYETSPEERYRKNAAEQMGILQSLL